MVLFFNLMPSLPGTTCDLREDSSYYFWVHLIREVEDQNFRVLNLVMAMGFS